MEKPEFRISTMEEIGRLEWNGFNVVSTFSGGGGSCLGYKMANFHVLWANEFVEEAQNTYRLNNPSTYLDTRDIRNVSGESILSQIRLKKGDIDLFDGSPPCCAFSSAGKREKGWGAVRKYSDTKQRVDDLFFEYIRLVDELKPKTFVAENVAGLVRGTAKGYFKEIFKGLKNCGYEVSARLLSAMWLGCGQRRERLIFVGVRKDICDKYSVHPCHPKPLEYFYTLGDVLKNVKNDENEEKMLLDEMRKYKIGKVLRLLPKNPPKPIKGSDVMNGSFFNLIRASMYAPCNTICQSGGKSSFSDICHPLYDRKFTTEELKRITSVPEDFILTGNYEKKHERLGRMVPPVMMSHIAKTIQTEILEKIK